MTCCHILCGVALQAPPPQLERRQTGSTSAPSPWKDLLVSAWQAAQHHRHEPLRAAVAPDGLSKRAQRFRWMVLTAVERKQASRRMSRQPQQQRVSADVPESLVEVKSKVSVLMEEPTDSDTDSGTDRTSCTFTRATLARFVAVMLLYFSQFCVFSGSCGHFQMSFLKKRLEMCARTHARAWQVIFRMIWSWLYDSFHVSWKHAPLCSSMLLYAPRETCSSNPFLTTL